MRTVAEVIAAASELNKAELRQLHKEISRMEKESRSLPFSLPGASCRLTRLNDGEFYDLFARTLAIEEDYGYGLRLFLALRDKGQDLNFAEVYLALKESTGESSRHFDDWKGSFSFPFALDVQRGSEVFRYLLEVRNLRDSLYFPVRKIVAPDDPRLKEHLIHKPFAAELSGDDINRLVMYFYGYLIGYWRATCAQPRESIVKKAPSNLIVFGWLGGRAFEEQFDSEEAYAAACRRYEAQVLQENLGQAAADPCVVQQERAGPNQRDAQSS